MFVTISLINYSFYEFNCITFQINPVRIICSRSVTFWLVSVSAATVSGRVACAFCCWTCVWCTPTAAAACPPAWTTGRWPQTLRRPRTATKPLRTPRPAVVPAAAAAEAASAAAAAAVVPRTTTKIRWPRRRPARPQLPWTPSRSFGDGPWRCRCGDCYRPPFHVTTRADGSGTQIARPTCRDRMAARL